MDSIRNKCAMAFLLISTTLIVEGIQQAPPPLQQLQEQNCKWEGHKLRNPEMPDKLFLCHFYGRANKWLLYPFDCVPLHRFDLMAQKCVKIRPGTHPRHNQFLVNSGYHPDENEITEVPDPRFTFENPILKRSGSLKPEVGEEKGGREGESRSDNSSLSKKTKTGRDDCGESLRSLASTIAALSKTIDKLSAKINNGQKPPPANNNATITLKFPGFFPFDDRLRVPVPKLEVPNLANKNAPIHKIVTPEQAFRFNKPDVTRPPHPPSSTFHQSTIQVTPSPIAATNVITTTAQPHPASGQSEISNSKEPPLRPGNNFFDFLMKNILSPLPVPVRASTPPPQANRNPFTRPQHYGIYKPLPFRPRPPLSPFFTPVVSPPPPLPPHSSSSEISLEKVPAEPKIPGFVNVLSFLKKLNEAPQESDEGDDTSSSSDEWNGIIDHFGPSSPKPTSVGSTAATITTTATPSTPTLSPLPSTSSSSSSSVGSTAASTESVGGGPSPSTFPSPDFAEFDNNDDEAEDAGGGGDEESLRLNNRKPRV